LSVAVFPRISNIIYNDDKNDSRKVIENSLHSMLIIAIPIFFGLEIIANNIILLVNGIQYLESIKTLKILAFIIVPVSIAYVAGVQVLIGNNRESIYLLSVIISVLVFSIISLLLISKYKQNGVALAVVGAETTGMLLEVYFAKEYIIKKYYLKWLLKIIISSIIMGLCTILIKQINMPILYNVIISIGLGGIVYFCMLILLKDSIVVFIINKLGKKFQKCRRIDTLK
jgi:O-antigen/teichoic acid export membrane protein